MTRSADGNSSLVEAISSQRTASASDAQVRTFTVHNSRPLLEIMITRPEQFPVFYSIHSAHSEKPGGTSSDVFHAFQYLP